MVAVLSTSAGSCGEQCLPLTEQQCSTLHCRSTTSYHLDLNQEFWGYLQMLVTSGSHSLHPRTTRGAQCEHLLSPFKDYFLVCCHQCCISFTAFAHLILHCSAHPLDPNPDLQAPPRHDPSLLWHHAGCSGATSCLSWIALPVIDGSSSTLFTPTLPGHIAWFHVVSSASS